MKNEKLISRKKYSFIFIGVAIAIGIIGGILMALNIRRLYDLPIYLFLIAAGTLIFGISQLITGSKRQDMVNVSPKTIKEFIVNNAILLALLAMVVVIMSIEPRFMQINVLKDILTQSSTRLIIALGICFTLLIGGTDLSAGRMVGLAAVVSTSMLQNLTYTNRFFPGLPELPVVLPILIAIVACMIFGLLNGYLVSRFDMHPFIATLATQVIIYGITSLYFDMKPNSSQPIGGVRSDFSILGQGKLFGISVLVPIALVVTVIIWFVLNKTVFGKNVYAIGGNRQAAIVSGINVPLTIIGIFILAAALYGIGGVLEAARTAGATNNYGNGYELDAIAACVVGGVSLNGGVGKVGGIVVGVLIFTVIQYGLAFIGISPMWQQVIKGVIIAVAVAIDLSKYRKR